MRQHRIERAGRQAGGEGRQRNDIEAGASAVHGGRNPVCGINAHILFRMLLQFLAIASNASASAAGIRTRAAAPCWSVPTGWSGSGLGFDEDAGDADRDRGARSTGTEFTFAARGGAFAAGLLHEWVASKITGAPVVRARSAAHACPKQACCHERNAALGDQHIGLPGAGDLGDDIGPCPRAPGTGPS